MKNKKPIYKLPKSNRERRTYPIIPLVEECIKCGKKVTSHHYLCNSCVSKRDKKRYFDKLKKLNKHKNKQNAKV